LTTWAKKGDGGEKGGFFLQIISLKGGERAQGENHLLMNEEVGGGRAKGSQWHL